MSFTPDKPKHPQTIFVCQIKTGPADVDVWGASMGHLLVAAAHFFTVSRYGSGGLQERMAGQESQRDRGSTKFIGESRTLFCNQHEPTMWKML